MVSWHIHSGHIWVAMFLFREGGREREDRETASMIVVRL